MSVRRKVSWGARCSSEGHKLGRAALSVPTEEHSRPHHIYITSGQFRRSRLATPGTGTHPMGERERLALFNMLDVRGKTVLDLFAGSGALGLEAISRGATSATFVEKSPSASRTIRENIEKLGVGDITEVITAVVAPARNLTVDIDKEFDAQCSSEGHKLGRAALSVPTEEHSRRNSIDSGPERPKKERSSRQFDPRGGRTRAELPEVTEPVPYDIVLVDPPYDHPEFFTPQSISTYSTFVKSGGTLVISHPKNTKIPPTEVLKPLKSRQYAALSLDFFEKV